MFESQVEMHEAGLWAAQGDSAATQEADWSRRRKAMWGAVMFFKRRKGIEIFGGRDSIGKI